MYIYIYAILDPLGIDEYQFMTFCTHYLQSDGRIQHRLQDYAGIIDVKGSRLHPSQKLLNPSKPSYRSFRNEHFVFVRPYFFKL